MELASWGVGLGSGRVGEWGWRVGEWGSGVGEFLKILVLGDLVPEIMPKNRFWAIFGPFFGFFQNPVKSERL